jgi:formylglycine-generating enzyme required for sulfatase activity
LGAALVPSLVACGALLSIDDVSYGSDAPADAAPLSEAGDAGACPGRAGPRGVDVGAFCIDETEVTNADYALFVADASLQAQPPACDWNGDYVPTCASNPQETTLPWPRPRGWETLPVSCVDWCDAYAYCRWAGKRLCGRIGGGPTGPAEIADAASDQWFFACSHAGAHLLPYGDVYDRSACNTDDPDGSVAPVKSKPNCEGGYPGIFDMSGNVFEWVDACEVADGSLASCGIRGGSYAYGNDQNVQECATSNSAPPDVVWRDYGFRCCSP